jgi:hypothetical protein
VGNWIKSNKSIPPQNLRTKCLVGYQKVQTELSPSKTGIKVFGWKAEKIKKTSASSTKKLLISVEKGYN